MINKKILITGGAGFVGSNLGKRLYLDMPILNYVLFKYFKDNIDYGIHINTRFNKNEHNDISIWKHK